MRFSFNEEEYSSGDNRYETDNSMDYEIYEHQEAADEDEVNGLSNHFEELGGKDEWNNNKSSALSLLTSSSSWFHSENACDAHFQEHHHEQQQKQQQQQQQFLQAQVTLLQHQISRRNEQQLELQHTLLQQQQEGLGRKHRPFSWLWFFSLVLLAHIIARYGPAAPPPPMFANTDTGTTDIVYNSWEEFLVHETSRLITSIILFGYQVPVYVSNWCMQEIRTEFTQWYKDKETFPTLCPLQQISSEELANSIVGQQKAIESTAEALHSWNDKDHPLLLYFAGSHGVGKTELAKQIVALSFAHCVEEEEEESGNEGYRNGLLILEGRDFGVISNAATTTTTNGEVVGVTSTNTGVLEARQRLYDKIIRHSIKRNGAGAVIVIQHVEKLHPGLLEDVVRDLKARRSSVSQERQTSLLPHLVDYCENFIFVFTSSIGSKTIAQSIKAHGNVQSIPQLDLELSLRHEIDTYFGVADDSNVASLLHAVAPFYPIQKHDLKGIIRRKLEQLSRRQQQQQQKRKITDKNNNNYQQPVLWKYFVVSDLMVEEAVSDQKVEYITIMKRLGGLSSQTQEIMTFASTGGKVFDEPSTIMNKFTAQMERLSLFPPPSGRQTCVMDYDNNTREGVFLWCDDNSITSSDNYYNRHLSTKHNEEFSNNNNNNHNDNGKSRKHSTSTSYDENDEGIGDTHESSISNMLQFNIGTCVEAWRFSF